VENEKKTDKLRRTEGISLSENKSMKKFFAIISVIKNVCLFIFEIDNENIVV